MKYKIFEQLFFIYRTISHGIKLKKKIVTIIISALYMSIINYLYKYIKYTIVNIIILSTNSRNVKIKYKLLVISKWNYNNSMHFRFAKFNLWFGVDRKKELSGKEVTCDYFAAYRNWYVKIYRLNCTFYGHDIKCYHCIIIKFNITYNVITIVMIFSITENIF